MIIKHICKFLLGKKHLKIKIKFLSNRSREHCFIYLQCNVIGAMEWRPKTTAGVLILTTCLSERMKLEKNELIIDKSIKYTSIE